MAKINNLSDFLELTSKITSFSHAYLFDVNSLTQAFSYVKEFAKQIILENVNSDIKDDIIFKIDNDEFDDLYVVNPNTISINTEEISKLLNYMETKSLRNDGRRVYIIYGFERLSREVSNKILKFLEEPNENIYALLMTENVDQILSTIISRCQIINLSFDIDDTSIENVNLMKEFLQMIVNSGFHAIANSNEYFKNAILDRNLFYQLFNLLEQIISENINKKCNVYYNKDFIIDRLNDYDEKFLIAILNKTNYLKNLIKKNINLNLLIDRYIIEISREVKGCKK